MNGVSGGAKGAILGAIAASGSAITVLSFLPWLHFRPTCLDCGPPVTVRGTNVEGVFDLGDGYVVAGLGLLTALLAVAVLLTSKNGIFLVGIALAAVATTSIAAHDVLKEWVNPNFAEITLKPALFAELALAITVAIAAGLLLSLKKSAKNLATSPVGEEA